TINSSRSPRESQSAKFRTNSTGKHNEGIRSKSCQNNPTVPQPMVVVHGILDESNVTKQLKQVIQKKGNQIDLPIKKHIVISGAPEKLKNSEEAQKETNNEDNDIQSNMDDEGPEIVHSQEKDIIVNQTSVKERSADIEVIIKTEPVTDDFDGDTDNLINMWLSKRKKNLLDDEEENNDRQKPEKKTNKVVKKRGARKKRQPKVKTDREPVPKNRKKCKKSEDVFQCKECDYKSNVRDNFREHIKRMHSMYVDSFECKDCGRFFGLKKDLSRHMKHVHTEESHFCDICGKVYKSRRAFTEHLPVHAEDYVKPMFPCEICGKTFSTKYVLTGHVNSAHLGVKKSYICPTCGRSFTQKNSYLMHANVHAGIKPYVCDVCGKAFSYDKSLKEHKYMHDTVRHFECEVCKKTFRQKASLQIHVKVHKETRDYICQSCGKGFTQKQALHRHERIHSGDKPFKCNLCSRRFNDYSIIRRHMIMLHKRDPKSPGDWKKDIICTMKRKTDFYIDGGTGYNSGERVSHEEDTGKGKETDDTVNAGVENAMAILNDDIMKGDDNSPAKDQEIEETEDAPNVEHLSSGPSYHEMASVAFSSEKPSDSGDQSPSAPINYSLPPSYASNTRPTGDTDVEESLARFQTLVDSYRSAINTRDIPPMPGMPPLSHPIGLGSEIRPPMPQGHLTPTTDPSSGQSIAPPPWGYSGYPYYNAANFPNYQGPHS
ncbi:GZF1-like protein, partial [Mya arenaria]